MIPVLQGSARKRPSRVNQEGLGSCNNRVSFLTVSSLHPEQLREAGRVCDYRSSVSGYFIGSGHNAKGFIGNQ